MAVVPITKPIPTTNGGFQAPPLKRPSTIPGAGEPARQGDDDCLRSYPVSQAAKCTRRESEPQSRPNMLLLDRSHREPHGPRGCQQPETIRDTIAADIHIYRKGFEHRHGRKGDVSIENATGKQKQWKHEQNGRQCAYKLGAQGH